MTKEQKKRYKELRRLARYCMVQFVRIPSFETHHYFEDEIIFNASESDRKNMEEWEGNYYTNILLYDVFEGKLFFLCLICFSFFLISLYLQKN